jgi:molybdopterin/thiamine biosynthesis adenylyltransferase
MGSVEQLSRTVRLFRTDLEIPDEALIQRALMGVQVALVVGDDVMRTRAGQAAVLTSALLLARSGHRVFINAFDVPLVGHQPPFEGKTVYEAVDRLRGQLVEGSDISIGFPLKPAMAFEFGSRSSIAPFGAPRTISVGWSSWAGELVDWPMRALRTEDDWPMGAMAAAVLVASEAIKFVGRFLAPFSGSPSYIRELFGFSRRARLPLAPEGTPKVATLGDFDIISAGAVSNALVYALMRLPDVTGRARAFDKDISDESNRNRNMLLIRRLEHLMKVELFAHFNRGLQIEAIPRHFGRHDLDSLAAHVAVGVDDIPTRWLLAGARVAWMGVGATSHFSSMASIHFPYSACAACLHPRDEHIEGPIPTIAFASFLAGLMVAADFLVDLSRSTAFLTSRQRYLTSLHLEHDGAAFSTPVAPRADCPAGCPASKLRAA